MYSKSVRAECVQCACANSVRKVRAQSASAKSARKLRVNRAGCSEKGPGKFPLNARERFAKSAFRLLGKDGIGYHGQTSHGQLKSSRIKSPRSLTKTAQKICRNNSKLHLHFKAIIAMFREKFARLFATKCAPNFCGEPRGNWRRSSRRSMRIKTRISARGGLRASAVGSLRGSFLRNFARKLAWKFA